MKHIHANVVKANLDRKTQSETSISHGLAPPRAKEELWMFFEKREEIFLNTT